MKKVISYFIFLFVLFWGIKISAASNPEIQAVVTGKVAKGENIEILINIKDIKSLYAGDFNFKYDPSFLKVKTLSKGDLLSKEGAGMIPLTNTIDAQKGSVRYNFTCFGEINGFSGTGTFIKMTAEVLKDGDLYITSKPFSKVLDNEYNLWMQLVDSDVKEIDYKFIPYGKTPDNASGSTSSEGSTGSKTDTSQSSTSGSSGSNSSNTGTPTSTEAAGSTSSTTKAGQNTNETLAGNPSAHVEEGKQVDSSQQSVGGQINGNSQQPGSTQVNKENNGSNTEQGQNTASSNSERTQFAAKQNNSSTVLIVILVILILGGVGAWYFMQQKKRKATGEEQKPTDLNV